MIEPLCDRLWIELMERLVLAENFRRGDESAPSYTRGQCAVLSIGAVSRRELGRNRRCLQSAALNFSLSHYRMESRYVVIGVVNSAPRGAIERLKS